MARRPLTVPAPYPVPVYPRRPYYWDEWYQGRPARYPFEITCKTNESNIQKISTIGDVTYTECTPKLISSSLS